MGNATNLSRRERQIMDVVYARGEASAAQIRADIPDAPSDSAIRALLRILEDKGFLKHRVADGKYIYGAVQERRSAGKGALNGVLRTFFDGSAVQAGRGNISGRAAKSTASMPALREWFVLETHTPGACPDLLPRPTGGSRTAGATRRGFV